MSERFVRNKEQVQYKDVFQKIYDNRTKGMSDEQKEEKLKESLYLMLELEKRAKEQLEKTKDSSSLDKIDSTDEIRKTR